MDEAGNYVFTLQEQVERCYSYSCGLLRVQMSDGRYMYVDRSGNEKLLKVKDYAWATDFVQGYAIVMSDDDLQKDKATLIDVNENRIFSFKCSDVDEVVLNPTYNKLASIDDDDKVTIYDLEGNKVLDCPSKVEGVYYLGADHFIFENDDLFGLMSYDGTQLIRAKYEQLVPNGKYFLAIHEDDDENVRIVDSNDNVVSSFDGEEIYDFEHIGFSFPNIIKTPDGELQVINSKVEKVGKAHPDLDVKTSQISRVY